MRKSGIVLFITTILCVFTLNAQIYRGDGVNQADLEAALAGVQPGTIVILGESHGVTAHRDQHIEILTQLRKQGLKVSVGLEFLNYPDQTFLDQFRYQEIDEATFLSIVGWKGLSFDFYRDQILFPNVMAGEFSLALNLPRSISSKLSKQGLESLTEDEWKIMPPNFSVGRDSYKERFAAAAGAHCPSLDRCFAAQSAWDDTMAWQAAQFIQRQPAQVLVIVVGEFHAQFGGGLADRIRARNSEIPILTFSQIWAEGLTDEEIQNELKPSVVEGPRADFIWLSKP